MSKTTPDLLYQSVQIVVFRAIEDVGLLIYDPRMRHERALKKIRSNLKLIEDKLIFLKPLLLERCTKMEQQEIIEALQNLLNTATEAQQEREMSPSSTMSLSDKDAQLWAMLIPVLSRILEALIDLWKGD